MALIMRNLFSQMQPSNLMHEFSVFLIPILTFSPIGTRFPANLTDVIMARLGVDIINFCVLCNSAILYLLSPG